MTPDEIRTIVLAELAAIAPEADPASIRPDVSFREQLDLDSMDVLNFAIALHRRLGVEIPESDYPKLATLRGCVDYLGSATPSRSA
jgi:acyl carrier protein